MMFQKSLMLFGVLLAFALPACDAPAKEGGIDGDVLSTPAMDEGTSEGDAGMAEEPAPTSDLPPPPRDVFHDASCDFEDWIGKPVDEAALKETGRPYRIIKPGDPVTMDYNQERINVEHENGTVVRVNCG